MKFKRKRGEKKSKIKWNCAMTKNYEMAISMTQNIMTSYALISEPNKRYPLSMRAAWSALEDSPSILFYSILNPSLEAQIPVSRLKS